MLRTDRYLQECISSQSLDFVDTVVTNIFSVAKQAGSTAKAIFNTLQAIDEVRDEYFKFHVISMSFSSILADFICGRIEISFG